VLFGCTPALKGFEAGSGAWGTTGSGRLGAGRARRCGATCGFTWQGAPDDGAALAPGTYAFELTLEDSHFEFTYDVVDTARARDVRPVNT
jgi:hypothetical protein